MTLKEWLDTPCKPEEIAYLDEEKTIAYIPIGIVEKILDEAYGWDTKNFRVSAYKSVNTTFVSGSLELELLWYEFASTHKPLDATLKRITRVGAATVPIYTKDDIQDYEGVVLSMALSNAAKKLGRRFGRHLNGRMEIGETAVKIKQPPSDAIILTDVSEDRLIALINTTKSLEELASYKKHITPNVQKAYMTKMRELT